MLEAAGWQVRPGPAPQIAVWGQKARGVWWAGRSRVTLEDAFLRGLRPGRRVPPYGLLIDPLGVHYDATRPSAVARLLSEDPLDDAGLRTRAEDALARWRALGFGKYLDHDPVAVAPPEGCILVVDQLRSDASVRASGAGRAVFLAMLETARRRWPGHPVAVRAHPDAGRGRKQGHLTPADLRPGEHWCDGAASPARVLARAHRVLTVSSQLGLDAIWAGHRPVVFGTPIYAGWGLSDDTARLTGRTRRLSALHLFAGLMLRAPVWVDPFTQRRTRFEHILDVAEAEARAAREDRGGYVASGMALWKRRSIARTFGGRVRFASPLGKVSPKETRLVWGTTPPPLGTPHVVRVEDGMLRSRGLGARLVPPVSLIADPLGLYYDPARPSLVEHHIAESVALTVAERARASQVIAALRAGGLTKYGPVAGATARPDLPPGPRLLVVGQVADDASLRLGASGLVRDMAGLLQAARAAHPDASILYKPHPDVEAGLRAGDLRGAGANLVLPGADTAWLLERVDRVWTLTSTLGFEALLRGVPVTCLGMPFYAGWGLTDDCAPVPPRRSAVRGVTREGLAHAVLIAAPRYVHHGTGRVCPVETALAALAGNAPTPSPGLAWRLAAKAQGAWASVAPRRKR